MAVSLTEMVGEAGEETPMAVATVAGKAVAAVEGEAAEMGMAGVAAAVVRMVVAAEGASVGVVGTVLLQPTTAPRKAAHASATTEALMSNP